MASHEQSIIAFARLKFSDTDEPQDLQDLGANLIELSRINNAIRLVDTSSRSYNPTLLGSPYFYKNRLYRNLDRHERLYVVHARKESPLWIELGFLTAAWGTMAVYIVQALIMSSTRQDQIRWRREDRQVLLHEYLLRRLAGLSPEDAQRAATVIYNSLEGLEHADNPLVAVDNLITQPQQREEVERAFRELTSGRDYKR
jgi:hypothetical protein